jgi:LDH2 family malate/lactate/ureidoglycolate dehydrogenase
MKSDKSHELVYAAAHTVHDFVRRLLAAHGVPEADSQVVADCLVRADLRGVEAHGITRLPGHLERIRKGLINPMPNIAVRRVTPVAASVDGDNGFGYIVATRSMAEAIAMARTYGIGIASARRSTHFGMAASYVLQAVEAGFVALVFTNAARAMPPWGGLEALLGTSPFAAGAPGGINPPFVLDMSPAITAHGKIRRAEQCDEPIPLGYALDSHGRPTTDPVAALQGVVLPIGGPKGSGLAMLMDIFSGVISGAAFTMMWVTNTKTSTVPRTSVISFWP